MRCWWWEDAFPIPDHLHRHVDAVVVVVVDDGDDVAAAVVVVAGVAAGVAVDDDDVYEVGYHSRVNHAQL